MQPELNSCKRNYSSHTKFDEPQHTIPLIAFDLVTYLPANHAQKPARASEKTTHKAMSA